MSFSIHKLLLEVLIYTFIFLNEGYRKEKAICWICSSYCHIGFCRGLAGLILFNLSEARIGFLHVTAAIRKQAVKRSWILKPIQELQLQACYFLQKKVNRNLNYRGPFWNLSTSPEFTSAKSNVNPPLPVHQCAFSPAKCLVEYSLMSKHPTFAERKMVW